MNYIVDAHTRAIKSNFWRHGKNIIPTVLKVREFSMQGSKIIQRQSSFSRKWLFLQTKLLLFQTMLKSWVQKRKQCFECNVNDCVTINSMRGKKVKELNRKGQLFGKPNVLTLFRMGFFGAAHGWEDPNKSPTRP